MRLFSLLALIVFPVSSLACSCAATILPERVQSSETIVIGKVIQIRDMTHFIDTDQKHRFGGELLVKIEETLKGDSEEVVKLYSGYGGGDCGVANSVNSRYLFFLSDETVSICDGHILDIYRNRETFDDSVKQVKSIVKSAT